MLKPDTRRDWDTVWLWFDRLDKGHRLTFIGSCEFAAALRKCEAAQKDKAIRAYVLERLRQRRQRRLKRGLKGGRT